jgi:hypothetical protein
MVSNHNCIFKVLIAVCCLCLAESHFSTRGFGVKRSSREDFNSCHLVKRTPSIERTSAYIKRIPEKTMTARRMETLKYVSLFLTLKK